MTAKLLVLVLAFLHIAAGAFAQDTSDKAIVPSAFNNENECIPRGGMPNFFAGINAGKEMVVAFLGGSLTEAEHCYRGQIVRYMESRWPEISFRWINAGVPGTGSDLGAFRLEEHVLSHQPDLVLVDFAVNGAYPDAAEGIVRKIIKAAPETDICFIHAIGAGKSVAYQQGRAPLLVKELEKVAERYALPSVHMAMEASMLEKEGKLIWKGSSAGDKILFSKDGLHPLEAGGDLYAAAIARGLEEMSAMPAQARPHVLAEPLSGTEWENAGMYIPFEIAKFDGNWKPLKTAEDRKLKKFNGLFETVMKSGKKESYFSFGFDGDMFGFFDLGGPDVGQVEILLDGELVKLKDTDDRGFHYYEANDEEGVYTLNRFNLWCNNRYRAQYDVIVTTPGRHQVTVRISSEDADKRSILKHHKDIDANPDKYAASSMYLGRILLRGKPIECERVKGVPKLKQQLKWDAKLERYAKYDRENPPQDDCILFVGSSTIENWKTLAQDFPGKSVLNRGVSGTKTIDMVNYFEHLVTPYRPKQIFLYPGDNDIGYHWTPQEILGQVEKLVGLVRAEKPEAEIVLISIKPSPRRMKDIETIREANALIRKFAKEQKIGYADVHSAMIGKNGELNPAHYREDGLHLTSEGYEVWKKVIGEFIR